MGDTKIVIIFSDQGPGLSEDAADSLFQPFFSTKPEGMGLGLSTSRKIAEQHGGTLHLENRKNGGAKAVLELPVEMETVAKI